jgi:chromatin segregation and condensation protein Rec8/ScpA/Scc1 (kleisin family)
VIVTFLALLELLRLRQIVLQQNDAFHEILIMPVENYSQERFQPPVIGGGEHVES